jgi:hypothetical protein
MNEINLGDIVCLKSDEDQKVKFTVGSFSEFGSVASCYFLLDNGTVPSRMDIPVKALVKVN